MPPQSKAINRHKTLSTSLAANKVTVRAHEEDLRRLKREQLEIENRKNRAKAARAEAKADAAKLENWKALTEIYEEARGKRGEPAEDELYAALRQLTVEGGKFYFDTKNLKRLTKRKD